MINKALVFAARAHEGQRRKDGAPFFTHPVQVAFELVREGANDAAVAAALLHDVVEDTPVTADELDAEFPGEVARLVLLCTENKADSWDERKRHTLKLLEDGAPREYALLLCADKLINLQSIARDAAGLGEGVWDCFSRPKSDQRWYYASIENALRPYLGDTEIFKKYEAAVREVFGA